MLIVDLKTRFGGRIANCECGDNVSVFRDAVVRDSVLGSDVSIGDDTNVIKCQIGHNAALNRRTYINNSMFGDYSYCGINNTINFAEIGKFCSLARNVDIGGFDHDYRKFTTMPASRFNQLLNAGKGQMVVDDHLEKCHIGNDVWIGSGAIVLHKVNVGDGAVIGAGSVVTKDVPPYAIVVGVPAHILKFRFPDDVIKQLLELKWWDWPKGKLESNAKWLIGTDVSLESLSKVL